MATSRGTYILVFVVVLTATLVLNDASQAQTPQAEALLRIRELNAVDSVSAELELLDAIATEYNGKERLRLIQGLRAVLQDALVPDEADKTLLDRDRYTLNLAIRLMGELVRTTRPLLDKPTEKAIIVELITMLEIDWAGRLIIRDARADVPTPAAWALTRIGKPVVQPLLDHLATVDFSDHALKKAALVLKVIEGKDHSIRLVRMRLSLASPAAAPQLNKVLQQLRRYRF